MSSNPLDPIWKAHQISIDCFEIAQEVIKQQKANLFTDSDWITAPNAPQDIAQAIKESNDLFVLDLWARFERFVITYLQDKMTVLQQHIVPITLASPSMNT